MGNPITDLRKLLNQLEQAADEIAKRNEIEHLAGPQGSVLIYLKKHSEKDIFIKDIEKKLRISKSVSSNLVKRMEKNGFIKIVPSPTDKRRKQILLTNLGRRKIVPLEKFHEEMQEYLFKDIALSDFEVIHRVTRQLEYNLEKYKGENNG